MSQSIYRDTSQVPIKDMDDLKRDIEKRKSQIDADFKSARKIRIICFVFAVGAIASAALALTPYSVASNEVHFTVSGVLGAAFIIGLIASFSVSSDAKSGKEKLSELRDRRKYKRMDLESKGKNEWVAVLWSYHAEVASVIDEYRHGARRYRTIHNRFQFFIIIVSSLVTLMATASASVSELTWVAATLSFLVASATGITGHFKYRERAVNLQRSADELEREYNSVEIGIDKYRRSENRGAEVILREFAEKAEEIKNEQRKREQQLEQSPESRSSSRGDSAQ
ncbi:DUF4231 domain-containing protein [Nocardiopsis salina]|uniref:DUF4231 domain-containing protein n=1 Tax=Nocardiopsis salina TaxID=245836 RepID=UPI0009FDA857|nr:DUF4231 domain-containing protein [Nocardiopsis salina]